MGRTVTREDLGAWVLKCNPETWDIVSWMADEGGTINNWSVGETYRNGLMQPGDLVVFWVSGTKPKGIEPGIWGLGRVLSRVHPEVQTEQGYWRDPEARRRVGQALEVDIPLWDAPIPREELKYDRMLHGIEVLTMPRGSNPSYLTRDQWSALALHLDAARTPGPPPAGGIEPSWPRPSISSKR